MARFARIPVLHLLLAALASLAATVPARTEAIPPPNPAVSAIESRIRDTETLLRPELAAYHGWIRYLSGLARSTAAREGAEAEATRQAIERLEHWTARIAADPGLLSSLRGVHEWAYESPADDSGQPFKIMIPTDYDPAHPPGLNVYMHGYTGDHLKHSTGMSDRAGDFEVAVLGRARGGWYTGLSQADVLHVIDYVEAHWRIDPARIRIGGGSMGGGGTFKLGSRHPHRFAAGQITCGYLAQEPIGNLLTFPIYATHSDDDMVVPVLTARGPMRELRRLGGQAILDLTTGYGHAAWDYAEGNTRSAAWAAVQVRPDSRSIRRIDFTALDGGAVRSWWAEVHEWGPAAQPARFQLTAATQNTLFAELTNITRLRLRLEESPFTPDRPLRVVVGNSIAIEHPAPLPRDLILAATADGWDFETEPPRTPYRLHTPGGAVQLYDGTPLLIVHGTGGPEAAQAAMRAAAVAASRSPNPAWVGLEGETDPADLDRTPHHINLFGSLRMKADTEVTEADMQRCHLVLIGSAAENSVVARLAPRLPVRFEAGSITCSDGLSLPAEGLMSGLVHYNPEAPQRLLFWVASHSPDGYAENATLPLLAGGILAAPVSGTSFFHAADFIVTASAGRTLVAARSLDTHWRWIDGRERSPLLPETMATGGGFARGVAEAVRRACGVDHAVAGAIPALGFTPVAHGTTRVADLVPLFYGHPIDIVEISGEELLAAAERFAAHADGPNPWVLLQPAVDRATVDPAGRYRIALPMLQVGPFAQVSRSAPHRQWRSDVMVDDALARYLAAR